MAYSFYISPTQYKTAEHNGISARTLTDRVRILGWDIEKATRSPPRKQVSQKGWVDIAKKNNILSSTFYTRVWSGVSPELAATTPVMDKQTAIDNIAKAKRKYPKEYEDLAVANGIGKKTFVTRMRRRWKALDAATIPVRRTHGRNDKRV